MTATVCHPDREHYAHGLCQPCYDRGWRQRHPGYARRARLRHPIPQEVARAYRLMGRFGLTEAEYQRLLVSQNGVCAICGGPPGGRWARYAVDHDHETGRVRGLLCLRCNRAVGLLRDDPALAEAMVAYLAPQADKWRKR